MTHTPQPPEQAAPVPPSGLARPDRKPLGWIAAFIASLVALIAAIGFIFLLLPALDNPIQTLVIPSASMAMPDEDPELHHDGTIIQLAETEFLFFPDRSGDSGLQVGDLRRGAVPNAQRDPFMAAIMSFDTSGIPAGAEIVSGRLTFYRGRHDNDPDDYFGPLWLDQKTGHFGSSPLGETGETPETNDFLAAATIPAAAEVPIPELEGGLVVIQLTNEMLAALNQEGGDGSGLTQFRLRFDHDNPEANNDEDNRVTFFGGNMKNAQPENAYGAAPAGGDRRPKLIVTFDLSQAP